MLVTRVVFFPCRFMVETGGHRRSIDFQFVIYRLNQL